MSLFCALHHLFSLSSVTDLRLSVGPRSSVLGLFTHPSGTCLFASIILHVSGSLVCLSVASFSLLRSLASACLVIAAAAFSSSFSSLVSSSRSLLYAHRPSSLARSSERTRLLRLLEVSAPSLRTQRGEQTPGLSSEDTRSSMHLPCRTRKTASGSVTFLDQPSAASLMLSSL